MKKTTLFLLIFLIYPYFANAAMVNTDRTLLIQRVEILRHEINVLRSLLSNFRLRQEISSPSYIAIDLSTNSVLAQRNSSQSYPIASITKLMSSLVALENIEKDKTIILTEKMLEPLGQSPSLYLGLNVSTENLLKASLIQSSNDASEALAHFLGKDNFLLLMNQKAKELGMNNTVFYDAHGLSPQNKSTPEDIAKLLDYVYQNYPEILKITKDNDFWLPDASGRMLKFQNVNNFYYLNYFIGGKTGYLPEARQTIAGIFEIKKRPVAIVLLYSSNRQADIFSVLRNIESSNLVR